MVLTKFIYVSSALNSHNIHIDIYFFELNNCQKEVEECKSQLLWFLVGLKLFENNVIEEYQKKNM